MDDHNFDHRIKEKVDQYIDPTFDQYALDDFHKKMAAWRPVSRYDGKLSNYLVAASLLLFTLVNAYLFWPKNQESTSDFITQEKPTQIIIDSLSSIIEHLKTKNQIILDQKDQLQSADKIKSPSLTRLNSSSAKDNPNSNKFYIGSVSLIPSEIYQVLIEKGLLITEGENAYLISTEEDLFNRKSITSIQKEKTESTQWPVILIPKYEIKIININPSIVTKTISKHISAKTRNELERHYFTGLGINLGSHLDYSKGIFSEGVGAVTPRVGIVADWVLSPRWSFESGIDYSTTKLRLEGDQMNVPLPAYDLTLGELENAEVKNTLLSMPLAVKYRWWASEKRQNFLRIGFTPYFSMYREYKFVHDFDSGATSSPDPLVEHRFVNSEQEKRGANYFGSTATVSLGFTKTLKNKTKYEGSIFFENSISAVGQERLGMQLFGLRLAYWLNLR